MRRFLKQLLRRAGYDTVCLNSQPASANRYPYASFDSFLQDIRARGMVIRTVIDVGANTGGCGQYVEKYFPPFRNILIEPQEALIPGLHELVARSGHEEWIVVHAGVAARSGKRSFFAHDDTVSSSCLDVDNLQSSPEGTVCEIDMLTLDEIASEHQATNPDLVKIDVEGLELEVIEGGRATLARAELVILEAALFEFRPGQPQFAQLVARMAELGFSLYDLTWFLRRPSDGALGLVDCVFAKDGGFLRSSSEW